MSRLERRIGRRDVLRGLGGAAGAALLGAGVRDLLRPARASGGRPSGPRNVLLLMSDQHRHDFLGHRGEELALTPWLDRLGRTGLSFQHAFCTSTLCVPGRNSIIFGRWVHSHGVAANHYLASRELPSFPQVLRANGFVTGCFGKLHVLGRSDLDWDELDEQEDWVRPEVPEGVARLNSLLQGGRPLGQPAPFPVERHREWIAKEAAIDFVRRHRDERWFLQCSFEKPHPPFQPPRAWWDRIDRSRLTIPAYPPDDLDDVAPSLRHSMEAMKLDHLEDAQILDAIQGYLGNIAFVDAMFGELLRTLEELGLEDDTLILFTSDSGELLYAHRLWKKMAFYEEAIRVPLFLRWPGALPAGAIRGELVSHVDVFPTICDLVGVEAPPTVQGRSLVPRDGNVPGGDRSWVGVELGYGGAATHRGKRWKVVDWIDRAPPELYDLQNDPREIENLAGRPEQAERLAEARAELAAWHATDVVPRQPMVAPRRQRRNEAGEPEAAED